MNRLRRHRRADRHRAAALMGEVTVRLAGARDEAALIRVAERDSRPLPPAPRLIAIRDAEIVAALSLRGGAIVADPFRRTAEDVELLRCHAAGASAALPEPPETLPPHPSRRLGLAGGCA